MGLVVCRNASTALFLNFELHFFRYWYCILMDLQHWGTE
jgi:hypothetical protein